MSTARELIREIKRRLGDTTTPTPDETDALAFLNMAVQGIHNYGVYLKSDRLKKIVEVTAPDGEYTPTDGIAFLDEIICKDNHRVLVPLTKPGQLIRYSPVDGIGCLFFRIEGDTVKLYPTPTTGTTVNIIVSYFPRLADLTTRDDDVPFSPELDSIIEAWTMAIIAKQSLGISDVEFITTHGYGNTLSRYFRGQTKILTTGRGPW